MPPLSRLLLAAIPQGIVNAINTITGVERYFCRGARSATRCAMPRRQEPVSVSSTVANYKPVDARGGLSGSSSVADTDFGFNDLNNQTVGLNKPSEAVTLSSTGTPANLGRMALETAVIIDGEVPDDLAIFVTGSVCPDLGKKLRSQSTGANIPSIAIPD